MLEMQNKDGELVFGLDIGTRNVVGTVGYKKDDEFYVVSQCNMEHETRSMLDGQIHDIGRVGRTIAKVKAQLEAQIEQPLTEVCIAAAGRVLKTEEVTVVYEYPEETVVTGEDIHNLDLMGVELAQQKLSENNDTKFKFYCVGYSVVRYYFNDDPISNPEGHKANRISEDIIVTFLPEDVVDGLYSAVESAGLTVANLTLEPIAAINIAIPEAFRLLNIALVDVGAGTSDISLTKDGSIIAYGMIPHAGDELTECIVQHYLVDFKTAEHIKLTSTFEDTITYQDIMMLEHQISSQEVWELVRPIVDNITTEVANKIVELNGGRSVSACFVVGGGGKIHGFTEMLADKLQIARERVALRGEEVLQKVHFTQEEVKKDPLIVTPIGICLNYYDQRNNFIFIRFNGERMKLYDNNKLTVMDAALQAGFPTNQLFPRRGKELNFTVNGKPRIARGGAGDAAVVKLNGQQVNLSTPIHSNADIEIISSTEGSGADFTIADLKEYTQEDLAFIVNGKTIICPKFVEVNGCLEPSGYKVQEGDRIELRNYYTVEQIKEFMDVEVDMDREILVNNVSENMDALVYENFSVNWTVLGSELHYEETEEGQREDGGEELTGDTREGLSGEEEKRISPSGSDDVKLPITVNGEPVVLHGRKDYMFVDIFEEIDFDINAGNGRAVETLINGKNAAYTQTLVPGDVIEIRWKEQ
ncbi:MAG: pilus assembly protein PilM [Lachnospiraceae bacterium]